MLHIDPSGIAAAAADARRTSLRGRRTLRRSPPIARSLPGVHIRDRPSLGYRGVQYDVSRGQMPTLDTLKRLTRILGEAKGNMLELYLEDMFHGEATRTSPRPRRSRPRRPGSLFDYACAALQSRCIRSCKCWGISTKSAASRPISP